MMDCPWTAEDVRKILETDDPERNWSMHGIGMLRTYLDPEREYRLNIWHPAIINPGISTMHDHPWPFESQIIAGCLVNRRYVRCTKGSVGAMLRMEGKINCGPAYCGMLPDPEIVTLAARDEERYTRGMSYTQHPDEIHETRADPGTITVIRRGPERPGGLASVFWPVGQPWGDASRAFDPDLAREVISVALAQLDNVRA